jgi:hypothetical protein
MRGKKSKFFMHENRQFYQSKCGCGNLIQERVSGQESKIEKNNQFNQFQNIARVSQK